MFSFIYTYAIIVNNKNPLKEGALAMENEKLFDFMTKIYSEMKEGFDGVNNRLTNVENRLTNVENRLTNVENTVLNIEQDHGNKLQALFDGHKQHSGQLERIEREVSKHDDFILRRVK